MTHNIEDVIKKYIELRDRQKALADKHAEEMKPFNDAMANMENWFMHQMNELGVDQLKAKDAGTVFRKTSTSVQLKEPGEFKEFIFMPAAEAVINQFNAAGIYVDKSMLEVVLHILRDMPRWDMVDFRAGKKGIQDYLENTQQPVPGVAINSILTVNVRRA